MKYATKRSLTVEISDEKAQGHGHLSLHDTGGVKSARRAQAISGQYSRKNGRNVKRGLLSPALPNSFKKGDIIYRNVQESKKKSGKRELKLIYSLKPLVRLKADVPFTRDFEHVIHEEIARAFPRRFEKVIRPARR